MDQKIRGSAADDLFRGSLILLVLGLAVCTLAGVVTGIALSPRKNVTIGSNNGNNSGNGTTVSADAAGDEEETEDEE